MLWLWHGGRTGRERADLIVCSLRFVVSHPCREVTASRMSILTSYGLGEPADGGDVDRSRDDLLLRRRGPTPP